MYSWDSLLICKEKQTNNFKKLVAKKEKRCPSNV
jgi:hypothetical protein